MSYWYGTNVNPAGIVELSSAGTRFFPPARSPYPRRETGVPIHWHLDQFIISHSHASSNGRILSSLQGLISGIRSQKLP